MKFASSCLQGEQLTTWTRLVTYFTHTISWIWQTDISYCYVHKGVLYFADGPIGPYSPKTGRQSTSERDQIWTDTQLHSSPFKPCLGVKFYSRGALFYFSRVILDLHQIRISPHNWRNLFYQDGDGGIDPKQIKWPSPSITLGFTN